MFKKRIRMINKSAKALIVASIFAIDGSVHSITGGDNTFTMQCMQDGKKVTVTVLACSINAGSGII